MHALRALTGAVVALVATVTATSTAMAQTAAPAPSPMMNLVPIAVMLVVMFFLVIRPQQKKQKEHREFVQKLERGDEVITTGGILGRIEGMTDLYLTVEIAPDVRIKVLRTAVAGSPKKLAPQTTGAKA